MQSHEPSPKRVLFLDARHIQCGDLEWRSPDGEPIEIYPPPPVVDVVAGPGLTPRGVRLVVQKATKGERITRRGPLDRTLYDGGTYRSWGWRSTYGCAADDKGAYSTKVPKSVAICYNESHDADQWTEPVEYPIDVPGQSGFDGVMGFIDPTAPTQERYKFIYTASPPQEERAKLWRQYQDVHPRYRDVRIRQDHLCCMYGAVSPDGLAWTPIREPLMVHMSDTDTSVYYDEWLGRYVMYTRLYWQGRRWVARAETEDFRHWNHVEPLLWPTLDDPMTDDIYTNARCAYPGLPDCHLMFPMFYHRHAQTSDVRLFASADGICWNRVPGAPVIEPGDPEQWDGAFLCARADLVPLRGDRVGLLYCGTKFPHKYPRWQSTLEANGRAWAWWPEGRLCAVAAEEEGEFYTFPAQPPGRRLRLNVRTQRAGHVRVGLLDVPGRSADECTPIIGDSLSASVHWGGEEDVASHQGRPVTLHFKMRAAELFGFQWE